jgi:hypothetical protein
MKWPPQIPKMPKMFGDLFASIIARVDAVTPKDGFGNRVTDATGGGKSINAVQGNNTFTILKDCYFLVNGVRKLADVPVQNLRNEIEEEP